MPEWPGTGPSPMSKVYREIGGGPVPGHSGKVAQLRLEVAPQGVVGPVAHRVPTAASHGSMRVASCKAKLDLEPKWLRFTYR